MDLVDIICRAKPLDTKPLFPLGMKIHTEEIKKIISTIHHRKVPRERSLYYKIMKGISMPKYLNLTPLFEQIRQGTVKPDDIKCADDPDQVFLTFFGYALLHGIPLNPLVTTEFVDQLTDLYSKFYFGGKLFDMIKKPESHVLKSSKTAGKASQNHIYLHYNLCSAGFKKGDIFVVVDLRRAHSPLEALLRLLVHEMTHVLLRYQHESYKEMREVYKNEYYINKHHTALFMMFSRRCYGGRDCYHRLHKDSRHVLLNVHYTDNWKYIRRRIDKRVLIITSRNYKSNRITTRNPVTLQINSGTVTNFYNEHVKQLEILPHEELHPSLNPDGTVRKGYSIAKERKMMKAKRRLKNNHM